MIKVEEYRRRAVECQELSERAPTPELRETYGNLAKTWSKMAGERLELIVPANEQERRALRRI